MSGQIEADQSSSGPSVLSGDRPVSQSNKCRICEERYSSTKYPVSLPCGHVLCTECEQGVSRMSGSLCPFCRRRYGNSDLRRIYNDAEPRSPHEDLMDVADRIRHGSNVHNVFYSHR